MPDLAIHFSVPEGADPAAVTAAFQRQLAAIAGVESAAVTADEQRMIGPQEIVVILTTATALVSEGALAVEATAKLIAGLRRVVDEVKQLGKTCGLGGGRLEAGMKQVPLDAVTDHDLGAAAASSG